MDFQNLLSEAQSNNSESVIQIIEKYKPLLTKESLFNGHFDEDLCQILVVTVPICIRLFRNN